ncbi:MAG: lysine--tRNA ligase [Thermosphaera sp.]
MSIKKHWIDELADQVQEDLIKRGKDTYVFNGGLSVSGLQHVGRLRGEVIITETLRRILSSRGLKIKQYLTLYTQDAWKAKQAQLNAFPNPKEAEKYKGWPLIRVPDPKGCHSNWVEHFWDDFGPFIKEFTDGEIEIITTTEMYQKLLLSFIKETIAKKEEIRRIVNKYRGRKPYQDSWIPIEPVCENCGRIDTTEAVNIIDDAVEYECKHCGFKGKTSLTNGKLMWRIEWVAVWSGLGVDFEPYGKDHAMPGGSRDSCVDLAVNVYKINPPFGLPYEWVALRKPDGSEVDMGSSDFLGFTPKDWIEVAHPHIYRFIVLKTPPMKKYSVSLHEIPQYYSQYFKAERIYYGIESGKDKEEEILLKRSYELSYPGSNPPETPPEQVPYTHLAILSQILPREKWSSEVVKRLQLSGHLPMNPSIFGIRRVIETMSKASVWVKKYGPENMVFSLVQPPSGVEELNIPVKFLSVFKKLSEGLKTLKEWTEENIKNVMMNATQGLTPQEVGEYYKFFYKLFIGKDSGPRAAPLISLLGKETTLLYLRVFE